MLEKLSYRLEALNLLARDRWGVRIVADQVKERYATLRFYWHCESDDSDNPTREQEVMRRYMELQAEDYVRQAERECLTHCEFCGKEIGTADSPSCWTLGWHHYLCTTCAQKKNVNGSNRLYMMDGKCYKGTTEVPNPFVKGGDLVPLAPHDGANSSRQSGARRGKSTFFDALLACPKMDEE